MRNGSFPLNAPRLLLGALLLISLTGAPAAGAQGTASAEKQPSFQQGKDRQIQYVKPKQPVRIKLHRNAKGEYQWDITGTNADEVVKADQRLRKLLKVE